MQGGVKLLRELFLFFCGGSNTGAQQLRFGMSQNSPPSRVSQFRFAYNGSLVVVRHCRRLITLKFVTKEIRGVRLPPRPPQKMPLLAARPDPELLVDPRKLDPRNETGDPGDAGDPGDEKIYKHTYKRRERKIKGTTKKKRRRREERGRIWAN